MIKLKDILSEAKKYKPNQKISKQEWGKIAKFNKHIGKDGKHYVTQLTGGGTTLVPVIVEEKLKEGKVNQSKVNASFTKVVAFIRKEAKKLNDDDLYAMTQKLEKWLR